MTKNVIRYGVVLILCLLLLGACGDETDSGSGSGGATVESSDEIVADNIDDHDSEDDYSVDESDVVTILLADDASSADGSGVAVSGNIVTISAAGTYRLSGLLSNGQVIVDSDDSDSVKLLLNGVDITCSSSAPLYVKNASKTIIDLEEGSA